MASMIRARDLQGVGAIPTSKPACLAWMKRNGVRSELFGNMLVFNASDLPEPERLAYIRRQIEELKLDPGTYDDAVHAAFMDATLVRRDRAERKAAIARLLVALGRSVGWSERSAWYKRNMDRKALQNPV